MIEKNMKDTREPSATPPAWFFNEVVV